MKKTYFLLGEPFGEQKMMSEREMKTYFLPMDVIMGYQPKAKKTYFLLAPSEGLVKIGSSNDPINRMADLRTMNAATVEPLVVLRVPEHDLHMRFRRWRDHGEWFQVCWEMYDYLKQIGEEVAADRLYLTLMDNC